MRAGRFWLAAAATGLGGAGFAVPEGNGDSSWNQIQATVASQPTQLTELGGAQLRMRKAADSNPSIVKTSGAVAAGWTGSTYAWGWFRLPDASGVITGNGALVQHNATGGLARLNISLSTNGILINVSADGTTIANNTFGGSGVFGDGNWHWIECIFDAAGVDNPTRARCFKDFVELSRASGSGTIPASLFNATAQAAVGCRGQNSLANTDTTDWAASGIANGIPPLLHRLRLANRTSPTGILLAA